MFKSFALLALVAVGTQADQVADDTKLCNDYCGAEWPGVAACSEVCIAAATGELTDCAADADASKEEKYPFWSGCSYGQAINKRGTCQGYCDMLKFEHHLSKFFDLGCTHVCNAIVNTAKGTRPVSCRNHLCNYAKIEACWRGCNYAAGIVESAK